MSSTISKLEYEELLADYSSTAEAIELLRQYRPYLELMPSLRRPEDSLMTIPLPIVKVRHPQPSTHHQTFGQTFLAESIQLPCELGLLMCDPEWKVKTGREIFVFIHRPEEDLSELLGRWRHTQVMLSKEYEWIFPLRYQHMLNEGGDKLYPLFLLSPTSPDRIQRGLKGAHLPYVVHQRLDLLQATFTLADCTSQEPFHQSASTDAQQDCTLEHPTQDESISLGEEISNNPTDFA